MPTDDSNLLKHIEELIAHDSIQDSLMEQMVEAMLQLAKRVTALEERQAPTNYNEPTH